MHAVHLQRGLGARCEDSEVPLQLLVVDPVPLVDVGDSFVLVVHSPAAEGGALLLSGLKEEVLLEDVLLELVEGVFGGLRHSTLHLLLIGGLIFLDACASLVIGLVVGLLSVDVPAEVFVYFLLFFLLEGVPVEVKLVLADSLRLQFLLCLGSLLPVLLLLEHLGVVHVVLPVLLLEGGLAVGNLRLVDLQLQLQVLVQRLFFELSLEVLSQLSVILILLRDNWLDLKLILLFLLILQLALALVQIRQVPLTDFQPFLVVVSLIRLKSLGKQFSDGVLIPDDSLSCFPDLLEDFLFEGIVSQEPAEVIDCAAVDDHDRVARLVLLVDGHLRDFLDDFHPVDHLPENHMFAVEMRAGLERDEELRGVGVPAAVGHREQSGAGVRPGKALVDEGAAVDGEAALAARVGNVSALDHKPVDDAVKLGVQVVQLRVVLRLAVLTSAEPSEVLGSFGSEVVEQLEDDPAGRSGPDLHVDVDLVVGLGTHFKIDYNGAVLASRCF